MTKSKYAGDPKILHELAEITAAKGMNKENGNNGKYIFINLSMVRLQTAWIYPKLLYAKGVAEKTGAGIIALYWREDSCLKELQELGETSYKYLLEHYNSETSYSIIMKHLTEAG